MKAESRKQEGWSGQAWYSVHNKCIIISTFHLDENANFKAALTLEFLNSKRSVGRENCLQHQFVNVLEQLIRNANRIKRIDYINNCDVFIIGWPIQRR